MNELYYVIIGIVALYVAAGLSDRYCPAVPHIIGRVLPFIGYSTLTDESQRYTLSGWGAGWLGHIYYLFRPVLTINMAAAIEEMRDANRKTTTGTDEESGSNPPS